MNLRKVLVRPELGALVAAVVIGGCLLTGGYGSVFGAAIGALILGMVQQGIFYTGISTDWFRAGCFWARSYSTTTYGNRPCGRVRQGPGSCRANPTKLTRILHQWNRSSN